MTQDSNPDTEPNTTPSEPSPQPTEPQTVETKVVPETNATPQTSKPPVSPKAKAPKTTQTSESVDAMAQAKAVGAELWRQAKPVLEKVGTQALLLGNRAADFLLDQAFPTVKEKFIAVLPAEFKAKAQEKIDPVKAKVVPIWQKAWPTIKKTVGPQWAKLIAFIRNKLPADLSGQLSDRFLNILVVTAIYLVWSFFSGLTHPSQAKTPESDLTFPDVKNKPALTTPEKQTLPPPAAPKVTTEVAPKPVTAPKPAVTPAPKVETPQKIEAPKTKAPKPIKPVTPKPSETVKKPEPITPKPVERAPKAPIAPIAPVQPVKPIQSGPDLIALKADLVDSVDRIIEDAAAIIKTVSVNDQQIKLQLGDRWYKLSEREQSKLAEELFSKSKQLSYERLDIRDAKDEGIARSPYIGDNMIILKRSSSTEQPTSTS